LAFVRTLETGWGIYAINADGSQEQRIVSHSQALAYPQWSPDGSQLIFHQHHSDAVWSVHRIQADGAQEVRLTGTDTRDAAPVWSPDGSQIAFSRDGDLWVMAADGGDPRLVLDDPMMISGIDWSPDGSEFVFESNRDGNAEIYLAAIDGSQVQRLTDDPDQDWWPRWSPDGSHIAFMSDRDGDWDIYTMQADGDQLQRLTDNEWEDRGPAWSPDGGRIAFVSNCDTRMPLDSDIYIMNADGSGLQRISEAPGMEWGLDWRPEPELAAVTSLRITILYDNYLWDQRLSAEWGFAALVEAGPHALLFDTGGNAELFMHNLEILEIDPKSIEAVVISHVHGDHIGGLLAFLAQADHPTVYLPDSFPSGLKERVRQEAELVEVSSPTMIFPGITTIGPLKAGNLEEQGLLVDLGDQVAILTGCAHPGVTFMVQSGLEALAARQDGTRKPVALLVGGFHLLEASQRQVEAVIDRLQELGVRQVVPTHCTGDGAIATFARIFGENYIPGGGGQVIELP